MTSSRPYLLRAIYDWLSDNGLTPYIMVDAEYPNVQVPQQFVNDGKIVLNISAQAVGSLNLANHAVEFMASFKGVNESISVPIRAVTAIYAFENGRGMVFQDDDDEDAPPPNDGGDDNSGSGKGKHPHLRVVK